MLLPFIRHLVRPVIAPGIARMAANDITVPDGYRLHTENNSHILLSANDAFLNPVQEFNRDLSVCAIRVYSENLNSTKEKKWLQHKERKAEKREKKRFKTEDHENDASVGFSSLDTLPTSGGDFYNPYQITILEALSATGLRSIRYAKEIPMARRVIANDLSPVAISAIRRNLGINGLGFSNTSEALTNVSSSSKVIVNEGDACSLMYSHRDGSKRVDVVDLDPYGTAAPFLDAAIQCLNDGGLLCITCTDLAVLAATAYPEKCFANYGGVGMKSEYSHEAALRLVLHAVSISAARYGRYIEPVLSLSIDFYVRLFVRIKSAAIEVKKAITKTSTYYVCSFCQSFYEQPIGRIVEKANERSGNVNTMFRSASGPGVSERCPECESALHISGPMYSGPLHDKDFVSAMLKHIETNETNYNTYVRMKGMLTVANEELESPFYFTPAKVSSFFHCQTPSLDEIGSALLHAGYQVARSHACPGSLKTNAPRRVIHDVYRSWTVSNPVNLGKIAEGSPSRKLLQKSSSFEANFSRHPGTVTDTSKIKLVRYQENPTKYWGPGKKASSDSGAKRKRGKKED